MIDEILLLIFWSRQRHFLIKPNSKERYMRIQITHHIMLWNLPMACSQHLLHRRVSRLYSCTGKVTGKTGNCHSKRTPGQKADGIKEDWLLQAQASTISPTFTRTKKLEMTLKWRIFWELVVPRSTVLIKSQIGNKNKPSSIPSLSCSDILVQYYSILVVK